MQGFGQLLARPIDAGRVAAAVLLPWTSVFLLSVGLGRDFWLEHMPAIYGIHVPLYFLAGPLLEAYVLGVMDKREVPASTSVGDDRPVFIFPGYAQLLPFSVATAIYLPAFFLPRETKIAAFELTGEPYLQIYGMALSVVAIIGLLSAGVAALRLSRRLRIFELLQSAGRSPTLWHFRVMLIWLAVSIPLAVGAQLYGDPVVKRFIIAFFSLGVLWFYMLDYRYPRFFHRIDREIRTQHNAQYERSKLENVDAEAIARNLNRAMTEERLYTDEDLTLPDLAALAGIHTAQLSELLNNVMGVDFRIYVNEFRVREAKRLLKAEPERSALDIAYEVGFNSKTAFNRNFKAITDQTPTEYREAHRDSPGLIAEEHP